MVLVVKNLLANTGDVRERCGFDRWVGKVPWRRKWQPTPGGLAGYSPWDHIESGMTEVT